MLIDPPPAAHEAERRPSSLAHPLAALRAAAVEGPLCGALRVRDAELVSSDFSDARAACVVDAHACAALNEHCFAPTCSAFRQHLFCSPRQKACSQPPYNSLC